MKPCKGSRKASFSEFLFPDSAASTTTRKPVQGLLQSSHLGRRSDLIRDSQAVALTQSAASAAAVGTGTALPSNLRPRVALAAAFLSDDQAPFIKEMAHHGWFPVSFKETAHGSHMHGAPRIIDFAGIVFFIAVAGLVGAGYKKAFMKRTPPKEDVPKEASMNSARNMPLSINEASNEALLILSEQGISSACCERLVRHIMAVENIDYPLATRKMIEMDAKAVELIDAAHLPMVMAVGACVVSAALSIPMTYEKHLAELTNYLFINSDVPEPSGMDNMWAVAGWSWDWMEPMMGVAGMVILCIQLANGLSKDMDVPVYHQRVRIAVANKIAHLYPQYDKDLISSFVKTQKMSDDVELMD